MLMKSSMMKESTMLLEGSRKKMFSMQQEVGEVLPSLG